MGIETATLIAAIITAIVGPMIVYYITNRRNSLLKREWSRYKKAESDADSYLDIDYGIKIIAPKVEPGFSGVVEITGVYSIKPPPEVLRLFVVDPNKTSYGERFWPQEIVKEFFLETHTWRAKVYVHNVPPGHAVIAAIVGQPTIVLWNYYYKVGPKIEWWDFEGWPQDSVICDRVTLIRA